MCKVLDKDNSGTISWEEFEEHMNNDIMTHYMASIGLEVTEVELFFKIVAGSAEEGEIEIDRFVEGCMQMKGNASSIDMQRQLFEVGMLSRDLKRFEGRCLNYMDTFIGMMSGQAAAAG